MREVQYHRIVPFLPDPDNMYVLAINSVEAGYRHDGVLHPATRVAMGKENLLLLRLLYFRTHHASGVMYYQRLRATRG
jgi:hypothetical protein